MQSVRSVVMHWICSGFPQLHLIYIIIISSHPRGLHLPRQTTCQAGNVPRVPHALPFRHYDWPGAETPRGSKWRRRSSRPEKSRSNVSTKIHSCPLIHFLITYLSSSSTHTDNSRQNVHHRADLHHDQVRMATLTTPFGSLAARSYRRSRHDPDHGGLSLERAANLPTISSGGRADRCFSLTPRSTYIRPRSPLPVLTLVPRLHHLAQFHQRNARTTGLTASSAGTCFPPHLPTWKVLIRGSLVGEIIARFEKRGFKVCVGRAP
jgi:hypothetical protein